MLRDRDFFALSATSSITKLTERDQRVYAQVVVKDCNYLRHRLLRS